MIDVRTPNRVILRYFTEPSLGASGFVFFGDDLRMRLSVCSQNCSQKCSQKPATPVFMRHGGKSPIFRRKKTDQVNDLIRFFVPRSPLDPESKVSSAQVPRRSVRREKGPPDLFLFPPHPIFRLIQVVSFSCTTVTIVL